MSLAPKQSCSGGGRGVGYGGKEGGGIGNGMKAEGDRLGEKLCSAAELLGRW